jgi:putative transposase
MSQTDDTLKDSLRQYLETIRNPEEGTDWLRDLMEWLFQELLDLEFREHLGAEPYERSEESQGYRNGYRQRELVTHVGWITLRVPRDRERRFSTELFERYQRSEKALVLALQKSYLQEVSNRKFKRITEKLCGVESSKDQLSRHGTSPGSGIGAVASPPIDQKGYLPGHGCLPRVYTRRRPDRKRWCTHRQRRR